MVRLDDEEIKPTDGISAAKCLQPLCLFTALLGRSKNRLALLFHIQQFLRLCTETAKFFAPTGVCRQRLVVFFNPLDRLFVPLESIVLLTQSPVGHRQKEEVEGI